MNTDQKYELVISSQFCGGSPLFLNYVYGFARNDGRACCGLLHFVIPNKRNAVKDLDLINNYEILRWAKNARNSLRLLRRTKESDALLFKSSRPKCALRM